jgi:hypothetical protein
MKTRRLIIPELLLSVIVVTLLAGSLNSHAQYTNSDWPPTINTNAAVDYAIFDPDFPTFPSTPAGWLNSVSLAGGGDQAFTLATLGGLKGDDGTSSFMNLTDGNYAQFGTVPVLDVLLQVWGDDSLYNANGSGKTIIFNEGILGTEFKASAGVAPPGGNNQRWNWMLLTITNPVSPNVENTTGLRYVGFQSSTVPPGAQNGGVNNGTLRIEGVPGLAIRAAAIGPAGAFGTSNAINVFLPPPPCAPEPPVNLAYADVNASITNNLIVLSDGDQTVAYQNNVGPVGDLRRAVQATATYMNFGILSNYLGVPCNPNRPMKVCVEFYDDPSLSGVSFGPENYALDSTGNIGTYSGPFYTLTGSGKWLKLAFWIPAVNLTGINTGPFTGGPRLAFVGGFPFIDRIELGVVRSGTNALAGLDPEPGYFLDPKICFTNYGYYVELDLQNGITNGLTTGSSGGDQNMVVEVVGSPTDMRPALAPTAGNNNLQFAIVSTSGSGLPPLGPTYQDNLDVVMALTYYDDPAMVGARLYPWPYSSLKNGTPFITFPNQLTGNNVFGQPYSHRETLTGSGKWKVAYFELPNVNLAGVNQGPQSVVRFQTDPATNGVPASGYIHVSRVRYDVVRPCGDYQGINMFQSLSIAKTNSSASVGWRGQATLQSAAGLSGGWSDTVSVTNNAPNSYVPPTALPSQFFRLKFRPVPPLP